MEYRLNTERLMKLARQQMKDNAKALAEQVAEENNGKLYDFVLSCGNDGKWLLSVTFHNSYGQAEEKIVDV